MEGGIRTPGTSMRPNGFRGLWRGSGERCPVCMDTALCGENTALVVPCPSSAGESATKMAPGPTTMPLASPCERVTLEKRFLRGQVRAFGSRSCCRVTTIKNRAEFPLKCFILEKTARVVVRVLSLNQGNESATDLRCEGRDRFQNAEEIEIGVIQIMV